MKIKIAVLSVGLIVVSAGVARAERTYTRAEIEKAFNDGYDRGWDRAYDRGYGLALEHVCNDAQEVADNSDNPTEAPVAYDKCRERWPVGVEVFYDDSRPSYADAEQNRKGR